MRRTGRRITILSKAEISVLYSFPDFDDAMRTFFFALEKAELEEVNSRKSIESRVHFILQLGYFKCKSMFFNVSFSQVRPDVQHILKRYFPKEKILRTSVSKNTRLGQQACILKLLNYRFLDQNTQEELKSHLLKEARICVDPKYLFDKVVDFLNQHLISLPGYSTLQDMLGQALTEEEQRLQSLIKAHLPKSVEVVLQKMLLSEGKKMYGITLFKKDAKGFNYKEITLEIKKKLTSDTWFEAAKQILPKLEISEENVCYYAYLVDYYTADRLKELQLETVRLYLLCYIFYRFEKINDNLISAFNYRINLYKNAAIQESKTKVYEHKAEINQYGPKINKILDLFTDDKISDSDVRPKGFSIVEKEKFPLLKAYVTGKTFDEEEFRWNYYKKIAKTIARNLRPLVNAIDFEGEDLELMRALTFLKTTFRSKKSLRQINQTRFPMEFIPPSLKSYLYETGNQEGDSEKVLNVYCYEFMIYHQLEKSFNAGRAFVNNSFNFKSLQVDLLQDWPTNKETVLETLNNFTLNMPIREQLDQLKKEFNTSILEVNQRIERGENKELRVKNEKSKKDQDDNDAKSKKWSLNYPTNESEINNPFYDQFPRVSLNQVQRLVNQHSHFMNAFTHVKSRYSKTKADEDAILACVTAIATNYGLFQMSTISDMSYNQLFATSKNFLRLETLKEANNILANSIADLPIFKQWNLVEDLSVSSMDGKKTLVRLNHIMARYSSKYFGTKRGVVSFSMIVNNFCTNSKPISPNEHESHHFYPLASHNTSKIQPGWHCGDTHSINNVNSFLFHVIGQKFTPHIKNIAKRAESIRSFKDPDFYRNYLIVPEAKFNESLIEEEWDNIQHISASILMNRTTQNIVIRKLSSHERSSKTQKALWEYNKILSDLHCLRFIDDPKYRKIIRTALNDGEGYHQLTGKIGSVNGGKFRGTTELELAIWNECTRLTANCIIYYNTIILSKIYETQKTLGNTEALEFIRRLSPIAWRHIILNGRYEFTSLLAEIDLDRMISLLVFDLKKETDLIKKSNSPCNSPNKDFR